MAPAHLTLRERAFSWDAAMHYTWLDLERNYSFRVLSEGFRQNRPNDIVTSNSLIIIVDEPFPETCSRKQAWDFGGADLLLHSNITVLNEGLDAISRKLVHIVIDKMSFPLMGMAAAHGNTIFEVHMVDKNLGKGRRLRYNSTLRLRWTKFPTHPFGPRPV